MGRADSVLHCYLNSFITNRLELKMPPEKKHKPLEGQTWLRFANKRPSKREEHRDENLQDERKTIGGAEYTQKVAKRATIIEALAEKYSWLLYE